MKTPPLYERAPEIVPPSVKREAARILAMTVAAEGGRQFVERRQFNECLRFLAVLADDPKNWGFLRG